MTTRETPPAPGLTRRNTGVLHGVYPGWYVTRAEQRNIERRSSKRYDPPANVTDIEEARGARTTGGKRSWSMRRGDEVREVGR